MHQSALTYAQVIRLPNVLALLAATTLARLGGRMSRSRSCSTPWRVQLALLAGWISFAATAPGLAVSPLAGAFLGRAGASRGIVIDLASAPRSSGARCAVLLPPGNSVGAACSSPPSIAHQPVERGGVRMVCRAWYRREAPIKRTHWTRIHGSSMCGPSLGGA